MTSTDPQLNSFEGTIQQLYDFRDSYFVTVAEELFDKKDAEIENKLKVK